MATAVTATVSFPSSKSSSLSSRTSIISPERISFKKVIGCLCLAFALWLFCLELVTWFLVSQVPLQYRDVSVGGRVVSIRAQVTTEAPAKVAKESKKMEEGVVVNKYKPKNPYTGRCLLNTKITGDDAPGETWHMVFSTEGMNSYAFLVSLNVCPTWLGISYWLSVCILSLTSGIH